MLWHTDSRDRDQSALALALLDQGIERDPDYAPALALAAHCRCQRILYGWSEDQNPNRRVAIDLVRRALQSADDDPDVLASAAYVLGAFNEDVGAASSLMARCLTLNPSFARGWYWSGVLRLFAGQPDVAVEHFKASQRLNPRDRYLTIAGDGINSSPFNVPGNAPAMVVLMPILRTSTQLGRPVNFITPIPPGGSSYFSLENVLTASSACTNILNNSVPKPATPASGDPIVQEDAIGIRLRDVIGVDNMMWGSDYPHSESTFPQSRKILAEILAGVPDDEQAKIAGGNNARVYKF